MRQLPWASVDHHLLIYCWNLDNMVCGSGGRGPRFLNRYLPKIQVCSAVLSDFSFRQLPWASVDYHLPIHCCNLDNVVCVGVRKPKSMSQFSPKIEVASDVAQFELPPSSGSFPLASAGYRRLTYLRGLDRVARGWWGGRWQNRKSKPGGSRLTLLDS